MAKSVRVIVEQVLPAYFGRAPVPPRRSRSKTAKTVEITLVRWPYT